MSGFLPGRRRWIAVVIVVLGLLIVPPLAWNLRPLTAVERKLVGVWIETSAGLRTETTFFPNRTVVVRSTSFDGATFRNGTSEEISTSSWKCSGNTLSIPIPVEELGPLTLTERMREWFYNRIGEDITPAYEVTFETDDRVRLRNLGRPTGEVAMDRSPRSTKSSE